MATVGSLPERQEEINYSDVKVIGNGSFGVVYQAKLCNTDELVAIKKVLQDKRFKVRKLMKARVHYTVSGGGMYTRTYIYCLVYYFRALYLVSGMRYMYMYL